MKNKVSTNGFDIPILFLIFNRPIPTEEVFKKIKNIKPNKIYIASDGPRLDKVGEDKIVRTIRETVLNSIDWDCEIKTLFRKLNLGAGEAVGKALDWFFDYEEMGIILEDDCLPSKSFFWYCRENLYKYSSDQRVMAITGDNFYPKTLTNDSYFFSKYFHMWGWATWKRCWEEHRNFMDKFNDIVIKSNLDSLSLCHKRANNIIINNAIKAFEKKGIDAWDYQFILTGFLTNSLTITPNKNLIKNLGFDNNATHTKKKNSLMTLENNELDFPIKHPPHKIPQIEYDNYLYTRVFQWRPYWKRAFDLNYIVMIFKRLF